MKNMPLVSVVMSVYNTKIMYLKRALDSVITQTYRNFEFIIIDDASDKWCADFLQEYCTDIGQRYEDITIKIFRNEKNIGLTASLNRALRHVHGTYTARMDADDICHPLRLERQIKYLETHRDINVLACSAYVYELGGKDSFTGVHRRFEQERVRVRLSMSNIEFPHPTVVFRNEFLQKNGLDYDESIYKAQDYNLWTRCIEKGKIDCLQEILLVLRIHKERISTDTNGQEQYAGITKVRCLKRLLPKATKRQEYLYMHMRDMRLVGDAEENLELIRALVTENDKKLVYNKTVYRQEIFFWWLRKCMYKENRVIGRKILYNSFVYKNIAIIFFEQFCRYLLDKGYGRIFQHKWKRKIISENWKEWI